MLKIRLTIIVLLVSRFISVAQVSENFDDGNFTTNPIWTGDISSFEVLSGQLHSIDSTVNSTYYLSTASAVANNAQWEIYLNLKFSTSSANYADVFLISDKPDVNNASNGYFVRIGGTPDEISLYRNDAGTAVKIIDGVDGRSQISSDNRIKITVTRSASNVFTLIDSVAAASPVILTEGTATDANYAVSLYFGISVKQSTASFFGKHYFDNIYCGNIVTDTIPPVLSNCIVVNQNAVDLLFSEPLEINSAQSLLNYSVDNGIGNPASVTLDGGNAALVHLTFANAFTNGLQNTITVNNVLDVSLNTIGTNTTSTFTYNAAAAVQPLDVVFSEIMADPSTGSSLPPQEYVEIYNRSKIGRAHV